MTPTQNALLRLSAGALAAALAACAETSDPADQEPVDPAAGLYRLSQSGAGLLKAAKKEEINTYCLKERDREAFVHKLAQHFTGPNPYCSTNKEPREGNRVAGEYNCAADPKMAQGSNRFVYEGAVTEQSAKVEVRIKFDADIRQDAMSEKEAAQLRLAMKAMEHAGFVIEAERIGDC